MGLFCEILIDKYYSVISDVKEFNKLLQLCTFVMHKNRSLVIMEFSMKRVLSLLVFPVIMSIISCSRDYNEDLKIYFIRTISAKGYIYQISSNGGTAKVLLGDGVDSYSYPCPSPDDKYLLCRKNNDSLIYSTSDLSVYRNSVFSYAYTHSWSPDGTKVGGTIASGYIAVYDIASSTQIWNSGGGGKTGQYFTNDSQYVSETSGSTLYEYIHTSGADTTSDITLTLPGTFSNLSLSPAGDYIACDNGSSIYLVTNTAAPSSQLLTTGIQPSWSPDGDSLIYVNSGNLYIYSIGNGNIRQLTFSGTDSYPCYQYKPR